MGFEPFWCHFWRLGIFYVFGWKIIFLMWEKNRQQSFVFLSNIFLLQITTIISALKFPNFKLQSIITFDLKAVDNFYYHICNKYIMLVNIRENKENRRGYILWCVNKSPPKNKKIRLLLFIRAYNGAIFFKIRVIF